MTFELHYFMSYKPLRRFLFKKNIKYKTFMAKTIPINPAPPVMNGTNKPAPTLARNAPPTPARNPVVITAQVLVETTLTPVTSNAAGTSPAA